MFDCKAPEELMEGMFHLIDGDCSSTLGNPEFILFIAEWYACSKFLFSFLTWLFMLGSNSLPFALLFLNLQL